MCAPLGVLGLLRGCRNAPGTLMLVSNQWQQVYLSTPALHAQLALAVPGIECSPVHVQRWLVRSQQRLRRMGHLCTSLRVHNLMDGRPHPDCAPAGMAGWLGGASRLTALELASQQLAGAMMPAVGGLTQLQQLRIHTDAVPAGLLDALLRLRQLTGLGLQAAALPPLQGLSML